MFSKSNSIEKYHDFPILISPNLGKPQFLSFPKSSKDDRSVFQVELLFIADYNVDEILLRDYIIDRIELIPITGIDGESNRGKRENPQFGTLTNVFKTPILPLEDPELLMNYKLESPRGELIKNSFFGKKNRFFLAYFEFDFSNMIKTVINRDGYILFDIKQHFPQVADELDALFKINYHSVVVTDQTWEDCSLIHATDLHIAKRNDEILAILSRNLEHTISKKIQSLIEQFSNKKGTELESRFNNPNNNLRIFIKTMNKFKEEKKADLIVFTGDITDYCITSDMGDGILDFDLPNTNWNIFSNIILNKPIKIRDDIEPKQVIKGEELLVPIFTVAGNHDYHPYHYDLRGFGLHKLMNTNYREILSYNDIIPANPLTSLYSNKHTLLGYNQHINPCQNFHVKLGDHTLLMLDSGTDDLKATKDLVSGNPSLYGFTKSQLSYVKNTMDLKAEKKGVRLSFFHAPIINPLPITSMKKKLRETYSKYGFKSLQDFKERNLRKKDEVDPRSDYYIHYNHGSMTNNWESSLELFNSYKINVLCGHTHKQNEFRTKKTDSHTEVRSKSHFLLNKKIEVPVAIYMDDYSTMNISSDEIMSNLPFHLQTPALASVSEKGLGAFRILKIVNNKLKSFKVDYISNYTQSIKYI